MPSKKKSTGGAKGATGRRPGGQPSNKNALKHGFYSERFSPSEIHRLDTVPADTTSEIALLRVFVSRVQALLDKSRFDEDDLKKLNTLSLMVQSISTALRTNAFLKGGGSEVEQAIEEAMMLLREEWGI